jgi:hypothetical protein
MITLAAHEKVNVGRKNSSNDIIFERACGKNLNWSSMHAGRASGLALLKIVLLSAAHLWGKKKRLSRHQCMNSLYRDCVELLFIRIVLSLYFEVSLSAW